MLTDLVTREPSDKLEAEWLEKLSRYLLDLCCESDNNWEQLGVKLGKSCLLLAAHRGVNRCLFLQIGCTLPDHVQYEGVKKLASRNPCLFVC